MKRALARAIRLAGGPATAAALFSPAIRPQAISQWAICPETRVLELAAGVEYQVTPHELRPDLYPYMEDGLPPIVRERMRPAAP